ncbi:Sugar or nucleoside kinase, ribokinase family [Paramicrobacterium humi]|uniref:Sugar or nucleoside kinase, ribokinase family n=1 Tax=Paramicrobacterium humi TaxID=640635 RepID=A0A1H4L1J4_9MICO|nr:carbohydrate kinase family protein [Microbacterium humi]SEB64248.1 Sugar or nucleoside kinase, ribokinase family [Microbacterium humi]
MHTLVVGDANPDFILRGDVSPRFGQAEQLLSSAELVLGGSASIVAAGLARLEVDTGLLATVGTDYFGKQTERFLDKCGIDTSQVLRTSAGATGISVILSQPDDRSILTFPGVIPTLSIDAVRGAVARTTPAHVHFSSYFLLPELSAGLPDLLDELRAVGISTSVDTNWDPSEQWVGLDEVLPRITHFMPNRQELRAVGAGYADDPAGSDEDIARQLAALGPRVLVKRGSEGGLLAMPDGSIHVAAVPDVEVVDTTGAGDSFNAGYIAAMAHGIEDEQERLAWATLAGSHSVTRPGGTGAQISLSELTDSLSAVGVAR